MELPLTAQDFINLITGNNELIFPPDNIKVNPESIVFNNIHFQEEVNYDLYASVKHNITKQSLFFKNCLFREDFTIRNADYNDKQKEAIGNLGFDNCESKKTFSVDGYYNSAIFRNITDFNTLVIIKKINHVALYNVNCLNVIFRDLTTKSINSGIPEHRKHIYNRLQYEPSNTELYNCNINSFSVIGESYIQKLIFEKCKIKEHASNNSGGEISTLEVKESSFDKLSLSGPMGREAPSGFGHFGCILISDSIITNDLSTYCLIKSTVNIQNLNCNKLSLCGRFCDDFTIEGSSIQNLRLSHLTLAKSMRIINNIDINLTTEDPYNYLKNLLINNNKKGIININNLNIDSIDLEGKINKDFELILNNFEINQITFNHLNNTGIVNFNNIKPKDQVRSYDIAENGSLSTTFENQKKTKILKITNSDLGKMTFTNCELFEGFNLEFSNSKLLDITPLGTEFPTTIKKDYLVEEKRLLQERFYLSQLKKLSETRGDSINALNYNAAELESYRRYLSYSDKNYQEKIVLFLNASTNKYGTDWSLTLKILIPISLLFYAFYCITLGFAPHLTSPNVSWKVFWELLSFYPEYLFPIRKNDFLKEYIDEHKSYIHYSCIPLARGWDYFSRIVISFLIFQLVQAFRKHGKK